MSWVLMLLSIHAGCECSNFRLAQAFKYGRPRVKMWCDVMLITLQAIVGLGDCREGELEMAGNRMG